jgi:hypothetical protein
MHTRIVESGMSRRNFHVLIMQPQIARRFLITPLFYSAVKNVIITSLQILAESIMVVWAVSKEDITFPKG